MLRALTIATILSTSCVAGNSSARGSEGSQQSDVLPTHAADPLGKGMGIQVQSWYVQPGDLARIAADGFSVVRWGIAWDQVEKVAGVYDWSEADHFLDRLAKSGLNSVVILGYGNRLYGTPDEPSSGTVPDQVVDARPPETAAARAAFARFAAAAAARYRDKPIIWEIWNEPDNPIFWRPRPDPVSYAGLAKQTCSAIRAVAPHSTILGAAGAAMPNAVSGRQNIYNALAQKGALACLSGLSSHAYRMSGDYREPDPESVEDDNRASRAYLYSELRIATQKRFVNTEWGFTTRNISANLQAAYLIRAILTNAATGVPLTIWYEWRDSRASEGDPESHFGLLTMRGNQKNTVNAFAILSKIAGARLVRRLATNSADARAFLLRRDAKDFLVVWVRTSAETEHLKFYVNGVYRADISFMPAIIEVPEAAALSVHVE